MILDLRRSVISHRNRANAKHARGDHDNKVSRRHELHEVRTLCAARLPCIYCVCCRCFTYVSLLLFTRLLAKFL